MITRTSARLTGSAVAVVLLTAGFWAGRSVPASTATPRAETGAIGFISPGADEFTIALTGTSQFTGYSLNPGVPWRDAFGTWNDGSRPACMQPGTHGQRVTLGVINTTPAGTAPGGPIIAWLECPAKPVPRYPIIAPRRSGPP